MKNALRMLAALVTAALPLAGHAQESFAPDAAPEALKPAVKAADQALAALRERLASRLMAEIRAGGPLRAVAVCRDEAPALTAQVASETGVRVGRTSHKLRNPDNKAPAWAADAVAAGAGRKASDVAAVAFALGDRVGVLRPIAMGAVCTRCHGRLADVDSETEARITAAYPLDQARGFAEGELRGFAWAEAAVGAAAAAPGKTGR